MPWSLTYHPELPVIEVAYDGPTSAQDLQESTSHLIRIEHEQGINRFVVDTRRMALEARLLDVHEIPSRQYVEEDADPDGRVAVILSASALERDAALLFRDTCRMRGWQVEVFESREQCLDWLVRVD
jgi:hypothetical protein